MSRLVDLVQGLAGSTDARHGQADEVLVASAQSKVEPVTVKDAEETLATRAAPFAAHDQTSLQQRTPRCSVWIVRNAAVWTLFNRVRCLYGGASARLFLAAENQRELEPWRGIEPIDGMARHAIRLEECPGLWIARIQPDVDGLTGPLKGLLPVQAAPLVPRSRIKSAASAGALLEDPEVAPSEGTTHGLPIVPSGPIGLVQEDTVGVTREQQLVVLLLTDPAWLAFGEHVPAGSEVSSRTRRVKRTAAGERIKGPLELHQMTA
jgi:hypothetical protein